MLQVNYQFSNRTGVSHHSQSLYKIYLDLQLQIADKDRLPLSVACTTTISLWFKLSTNPFIFHFDLSYSVRLFDRILVWKCHFLLTNCKYFLIKTFPSFANKDFDRSICAIKSRRFWQLVHQRVYLEPCQTSLLPLFGKVVILFTNFAKKLHHRCLAEL